MMKKYLLLVFLVVLGACMNPELDKTKDEIAQLKLEYEKLTEVYNEMVETRIPLSEKVVDLDKEIQVDLSVLEKDYLTVKKGEIETVYPVIFGLHDYDHGSPIPIILSEELYSTVEVGKRYRFTINALFYYESEHEEFHYKFTSETAYEVAFSEK